MRSLHNAQTCSWLACSRGMVMSALWWGLQSAAAADFDICEKDELPYAQALECDRAISAQSSRPLESGRKFTLRGYAWLREGEPTSAVADFSRAVTIDPSNIAALKGRARAKMALKAYDAAILDWSAIIAQRPDAEEYYRERARAHLEDGHAREAFADFDKSIELKAKNPESYIGRAQIYQRLQMREAALREFDTAAAIDPSYANTYFAKAQAAESWGDAELAIRNYALVVRYKGDVWYAQRAMKRLGRQFSDLEDPSSTSNENTNR